MTRCSALILPLLAFSLSGQSQDSGIDFHTPPEWRGETIELPPGFAPDLKWNGVEHIRFAPGMFQPDSESFFSYVLVFLLEKDSKVSEESVKEQVLTYYQGLSKAVMAGKGQTVDVSDFSFEYLPGEAPSDFPPKSTDGQEMKTWTGVLDWVEPFATQKRQKLTIEIHLWNHKEETIVYFTVSPREKDHAIWKEMRKYRAEFEVK